MQRVRMGAQPARASRGLATLSRRCRVRTHARKDKAQEKPPIQESAPAAPQEAEEDGFVSHPPAYPLYSTTPQPQQAQQAPYHAASAPPPPPPPQYQQPQSSGPPFYVWVLVGAAAAWVFGKVQEFRRNPLKFMAGMMGGGGGGASPPTGGAAGGGAPDMAAMMAQFQQMQAAQGGGAGAGTSPFGGAMGGMGGMGGATGPTINTTASDVPTPTPAAARDGSKFQEKANAQASSAREASSSDSAADAAAAAPPATEAPTSTPAASAPSASFFSDTPTPRADAGDAAAPRAGFFADTPASPAANGNGGAAGGETAEQSEQLVDNLLEMVAANPELQKQMEKHLPEGQRGPEVWDWLQKSPEMRKQLAKQLATSPDMINMMDMQNAPPGMEDLKAQGIDPNAMMSEMMKDPEVMTLMQKPHVIQALMDIQTDPNKATQYLSDPDISKVMMKVTQLQMGQMSKGQ